jgi:hypothetical protein
VQLRRLRLSSTIGKYKQSLLMEVENPVQVVYDEAKACYPNREIQCIVSIGAGKAALEGFGQSLKAVGETLVAIATDTDETAALFAKTHLEYDKEGSEKRLFRFQVAHGLEKVGMAEHEKIKEIAAATQIYIEQGDQVGRKHLLLFKQLISWTRE